MNVGVLTRKFIEKNGIGMALFMMFGVSFWILFLIVLPQLTMVDFSFRFKLPPDAIGGAQDVYTTSNYEYFVNGNPGNSDGWNRVDVTVFWRTLIAALFVTVFNFVICYPIAYYMAKLATGSWARLLALSLVVPYWINEILRAFAFRIIFGDSGLINTVLKTIGIIDSSIDFIRADIALYAGLGYAYVLLMIFPLYSAIEALDKNQIEAARDMGSPWWRIHWRIVMPFAKAGITSGCTMVFMLSAGALAAPQILGGPSSLWFTQIIYQGFFEYFNWNRGAAYAIILLVSCMIIVLGIMKLFRVKMGEIGR
ncbi:MAG: ABC transporter permease [Proteobacteria bacterium]|nr:ABC transporter permease [Pseudomonadota bacterium]